MTDDLLKKSNEDPFEPAFKDKDALNDDWRADEFEEFGGFDYPDGRDSGLEFGDDGFEEFYDEMNDEGEGQHVSLGQILAFGAGENVEMRTAVMLKNEMIALLCIKSASRGAAICRVDPREPLPAIQLYDDAETATEWYVRSLRTSQKNGWRIAYYGLPLRG